MNTINNFDSMNLHAEKIELIKLVLQTEKESVLKKLKQVLVDDVNENQHELTLLQKTELDRRLRRMENDETEFYTWEDLEQKLK
ncbi:putative addiction module component [Gelidibacter algens]|uniref:Putative addiction module component n=1 Tax=Gelidibacter algens TaxID=49280 RepID=A0A327S856_9FLAO|nr:putative addiction module component [Gelidibacter algens]